MGYGEVNLNLGCPSGTVTAKGKGAGFLGDLPRLERFLDEIFARSPLPISIKTRMGVSDPEEFGPILALYNRSPVKELHGLCRPVPGGPVGDDRPGAAGRSGPGPAGAGRPAGAPGRTGRVQPDAV